MNTRPLLTVVLPPPAPTAEPTEATAGSRITALIKACWRSAMAWKEISCAASDRPMINPVSCCGKKPLGIDDVEIAGQRDGAEHHHQRDEAVPQHDLQACLIEVEQAIEAAFEQPVEPSVLLALAA